jgi:hypothetical protein
MPAGSVHATRGEVLGGSGDVYVDKEGVVNRQGTVAMRFPLHRGSHGGLCVCRGADRILQG